MVFTHNKQIFNVDQFDPLSNGLLRGWETSSQLFSLTEISTSSNAISKAHITDFGKENVAGNSEYFRPGSTELQDNSLSSVENFNFAWLPSNGCEADTLDHGKRPFSDVKPCQVACKRPKQTDQSTNLYALEEHSPSIAVEKPSTTALADEFVVTRESDYIPVHTGTTTCNDGLGFPCSNGENSIGEESLYSPTWAASFPSYLDDHGLVATYNEVDDIDSPIHEYLPRKTVPVGPDHQAVIPECRTQVSVDVSSGSGSCADLPLNPHCTSESAAKFVDHRDEDIDSEKWINDCVMLMPVSYSDPVASIADYKTGCDCSDEGSIRCVRQHVLEARESLKRSLGEEKFNKLGLSEMGEDIALRWTEEEERLFRRVVFSNPASLGKNFWNYLPNAFPEKTSNELVSYYFNVFMLQKRAQQNRSDLMHVDSDDDEMLESEGDPVVEEEEDSAVESPTETPYCNHPVSTGDVNGESEGEDLHKFPFHVKVISDVPEPRCPPNVRTMESNLENFVDDRDIQDESCTSFEGQQNAGHYADQAPTMCNDTLDKCGDMNMMYVADDASMIRENGLFSRLYDLKTWTATFPHRKQDDEFLPTCNVKEVGMGDWESCAMGGHDHS